MAAIQGNEKETKQAANPLRLLPDAVILLFT